MILFVPISNDSLRIENTVNTDERVALAHDKIQFNPQVLYQ